MTDSHSRSVSPRDPAPAGPKAKPQNWEQDSDSESDEITLADVVRSLRLRDPRPRTYAAAMDKQATPPVGTQQHPQTTVQVNTSSSIQTSPSMKGDTEAPDLVLCPLSQIQAYPFRFVGTNHKDKVKTWFQKNMWTACTWDMYYACDPTSRRKPIYLVPTVQFQEFLEDANTALKTKLAIPDGNRGEKLQVVFEGFPRPHFLGSVRSQEDFENLKRYALPSDSNPDTESTRIFNQKLEEIYQSFKPAKKRPEVRYWNQVARRKNWSRTIKRVQRYLGLRQRVTLAEIKESPAVGWQVTSPAPFASESAVKFVCVDVEAYERNRNMVTEVGIAVLDTKDIDGIPPGDNGANWFQLIKAYHLRVDEYKGIVNSEFVQGCPHAFNFGKSEFVALSNVARRVGSILGDNESSDTSPIVMVGHETGADLQYLLKVNYNIWNSPRFHDEVDTKTMFQRIQLSREGRALHFVCSELGIPGVNFHNAGNDAVYTMRAMVAMAIRKKVGGPQTESERWGQKHEDVNMIEWTDGDADDGGSAVKSAEPGE